MNLLVKLVCKTHFKNFTGGTKRVLFLEKIPIMTKFDMKKFSDLKGFSLNSGVISCNCFWIYEVF